MNCSVINKTYESLAVSCSPGFNGGLRQSFIARVSTTDKRIVDDFISYSHLMSFMLHLFTFNKLLEFVHMGYFVEFWIKNLYRFFLFAVCCINFFTEINLKSSSTEILANKANLLTYLTIIVFKIIYFDF